MTPVERAYEQLAELAYDELVLAERLDVDALHDVQARRAALVATLPDMPPPAARGALERCAELQRRTSARLAESVAEAAAELSRLDRGRTAARGYAPVPAQAPVGILDRPA